MAGVIEPSDSPAAERKFDLEAASVFAAAMPSERDLAQMHGALPDS